MRFGFAPVQSQPRFDAMFQRAMPAEVSREHFIIGEGTECVGLIAQYAALGIGAIVCFMNFGGPDLAAVERSMWLAAAQVMPCFASG